MFLSNIHIYPVKSTRRISLAEARVEFLGLEGDRRWMVVDAAHRFLTQREAPRLALVQAWRVELRLMLAAPGMNLLSVPLPGATAHRLTVNVWRDSVMASPAGDAADQWFTSFLGRPCQLVYMDNPRARLANPDYAAPGSVVSFADGFPLLVTSTGSLAALNRLMSKPVPMHRFRPNVVIAGSEAFAEDNWHRIQIGGVCFQVAKPCTRCIITTTSQDTAVRGKEPLRTLSTFRKRGSNVYFGENLVPETPGTIRVGDEVSVLEWRPHPKP